MYYEMLNQYLCFENLFFTSNKIFTVLFSSLLLQFQVGKKPEMNQQNVNWMQIMLSERA